MVDEEGWFGDNRRYWDERAPIHARSTFYDVEGFLAGREVLEAFVIEEVGPVEGRTLFHPQCHFGLEPLGWARRGAVVTGLDFSAEAIGIARDLAERAALDVEFICANVYDAPAVLEGRTFDVVHTGLGALNWLPDLERWAATMAAVCRPGGVLHLAEFHPVVTMFLPDSGTATLPLVVRNDYFDGRYEGSEAGSYADADAETVHNRSQEQEWPLGDVVTAVIDAGFALEFLHEHRHTLYGAVEGLEQAGNRYELPPEVPSPPMIYSLRAVRR